jgi:hypothetical protein
MKKLLRYILPYLLCILTSYISAQSTGIGNFYDHLPYHKGSSLCISKEKIYVASGQAIFTYDLSDNSIETYSKVNKLSDLGVTSIAYSEKHNSVVIGYETGNIDLIVNNQVINIPDVKRTSIQGFKSINEILIKEDFAFLSTGLE